MPAVYLACFQLFAIWVLPFLAAYGVYCVFEKRMHRGQGEREYSAKLKSEGLFHDSRSRGNQRAQEKLTTNLKEKDHGRKYKKY